MNRSEVIQHLKDLPEKRMKIADIPETILSLEIQYKSIRAARTDGDKVSGGSISREDALI